MRFEMNTKFILIYIVMMILLLFLDIDLQAQCSMCNTQANSAVQNGDGAGMGLNDGILYLLAAPYLLVVFLGIIWYKKSKRASEA